MQIQAFPKLLYNTTLIEISLSQVFGFLRTRPAVKVFTPFAALALVMGVGSIFAFFLTVPSPSICADSAGFSAPTTASDGVFGFLFFRTPMTMVGVTPFVVSEGLTGATYSFVPLTVKLHSSMPPRTAISSFHFLVLRAAAFRFAKLCCKRTSCARS